MLSTWSARRYEYTSACVKCVRKKAFSLLFFFLWGVEKYGRGGGEGLGKK